MAPVTLPPSFFNSFWSPDYRSGLEVLFKQLEQGCVENSDIVEFIEVGARHCTIIIALYHWRVWVWSDRGGVEPELMSLSPKREAINH